MGINFCVQQMHKMYAYIFLTAFLLHIGIAKNIFCCKTFFGMKSQEQFLPKCNRLHVRIRNTCFSFAGKIMLCCFMQAYFLLF